MMRTLSRWYKSIFSEIIRRIIFQAIVVGTLGIVLNEELVSRTRGISVLGAIVMICFLLILENYHPPFRLRSSYYLESHESVNWQRDGF
jgi:hypothetical protein